jgi:4,5-DOPA dioxygenase extradiol
MPVLFIGHGNPMNAVRDNPFTRALRSLRRALPRPETILCVSAHWLTDGTWVTHMAEPRTIHDFWGFPQELFKVQYNAPGNPAAAETLARQIQEPKVLLDDALWGLDHGTWSVLKHMYPEADVPVFQLSIDLSMPSSHHFALGRELRSLRERGILILGSGNIVHNLGQIRWEPDAAPHDWAVEFDEWVQTRLECRDYGVLMNEGPRSRTGRLSVPSPDHWYPLLYTLGASDENDHLQFEYEGIEHGSISMRCLSLR